MLEKQRAEIMIHSTLRPNSLFPAKIDYYQQELSRAGRSSQSGVGGVPVGTHRVEIRAFCPDEDAEPDPLEGDLPRKQYLPEKYNTKTEMEITIEPGSGKITKNFDLTD
jgi:hypothetical protein